MLSNTSVLRSPIFLHEGFVAVPADFLFEKVKVETHKVFIPENTFVYDDKIVRLPMRTIMSLLVPNFIRWFEGASFQHQDTLATIRQYGNPSYQFTTRDKQLLIMFLLDHYSEATLKEFEELLNNTPSYLNPSDEAQDLADVVSATRAIRFLPTEMLEKVDEVVFENDAFVRAIARLTVDVKNVDVSGSSMSALEIMDISGRLFGLISEIDAQIKEELKLPNGTMSAEMLTGLRTHLVNLRSHFLEKKFKTG